MAKTGPRRLQADGHRLEQVVTAEHLAVRAGELIEGGQREVDDAGHRAKDESLVAFAIGADQVDNASQISGALAPDDLKCCPARVGELRVQVAAHAYLTGVALSPDCWRTCFPTEAQQTCDPATPNAWDQPGREPGRIARAGVTDRAMRARFARAAADRAWLAPGHEVLGHE